MQELCESVLKNPFILRDCGCGFDEKTKARLERENEETWKALLALKQRGKISKKRVELQKGVEDGSGKEIAESKEIAKKTKECIDYRFTKWSKLKMLRAKMEKEQLQTCLQQYKKMKFFSSLVKLKITLSRKEWENTCHLERRRIIPKNIRLENVLRIRWKYNIDDSLPADSIIFDKITKYEEDKKKHVKLRQERMIDIVKKIVREMNNGIRAIKKPKDLKPKKIILEEISEESFTEISFEEFQEKESLTAEIIEQNESKDRKIENSELKFEEDQKVEDKTVAEAKEKEVKITKKVSSSIEQTFPKDTSFFSVPSLVTFDDFEVNKVYSQKLLIRNKTIKWAYLRFYKIYTEVWEPGIVELDIMDAARVKPGLDAQVTVRFSPIYEEEVTAEIAFLTLTADDTKTFHEFRVPVRCTPQSAVPTLDPKELRFPTAPIWKYEGSKFSERILRISNDGRKPFSIVIEERNARDHCFLWHFDQAEIQSVQSSILCMMENGEENTENSIEVEENISNNQKLGKMYQIEVPPKLKCDLRITFRPKYIGLHHEVLQIYFLRDNRIFGKQEVPIWTEVTSCQVHLDPPCVDLGIVMIDSDICQQTFNIINTGRCSVEALIKTPKCLGNQVSVYPKTTTVQSETSSKISVRLIPESRIVKVAKRFYDAVSSMLEFPIRVQILSQDSDKPPPLIVKILATLTTCRGLVLEPADVDLGYVHTHESVYTEVTLTNESLLIQEYAFLNLPESMEIQPNHGFGAILPGETIKLHLIYSPSSTDIPGNEIGANGLAGERSFLIQVVSLAELAGSKKESTLNRLKNQIDTLAIIPRNRGSAPSLPVDLKKVKTMRRENDLEKDDFGSYSDSDSLINEKELCDKEGTPNVSLEDKSTRFDGRKEKNAMEVYAYIIDTFCELSEQVVEFPATSCGSYSMVSVHLRGFNAASYPRCTCGTIKSQKKEFTGRYEFQSSSDRMKIQPESGIVRSNEIIQVNFLFKPKLPKRMIFEEGLRLKMNVEEQATKSSKDDKSPKKGARRKEKAGKKEAADKKKEVSEVDKSIGELSLLETFESCVSTVLVTCTIDLEMKNGTKRDELLFAKLICPITRPEILLLNEGREIKFGPTAIRTSCNKILLVKNISTRSVKVQVSLLDPFGPFFVSTGKSIETGSILKLLVTYKPLQEREQEDEEHFEVFSSNKRTRWIVKVSGRGVVPSHVPKPRLRAARFQVTDDKPVA